MDLLRYVSEIEKSVSVFILAAAMRPQRLTPFFAHAGREAAAWQELTEQTAVINGTLRPIKCVTNPVYQGSVQLRSDAANPVAR